MIYYTLTIRSNSKQNNFIVNFLNTLKNTIIGMDKMIVHVLWYTLCLWTMVVHEKYM